MLPACGGGRSSSLLYRADRDHPGHGGQPAHMELRAGDVRLLVRGQQPLSSQLHLRHLRPVGPEDDAGQTVPVLRPGHSAHA